MLKFIVMLRYLWIVTVFLTASTSVRAQYKQHQPFKDYYTALAVGPERGYQRFFVGVGKHLIPGRADLHYKGLDTLGNPIDTNFHIGVHSRHSFVLYGGTYFPFVLISDNSVLAFSVEFLGSYSDLTLDSVFFNPKSLYKKSESIIMLGIPISLDFKTGGDIPLNKTKRQMFTIGGGILVGGTNNFRSSEKQVPFVPIPFLKLEAGVFAGIALKLRATAYFGDANYIDRKTGNIFGNDELYTKTRSGYGYDISLIIMPFSPGWQSEKWH